MTTVAMTQADIGSASEYLPERRSLADLRKAAGFCKACDLWLKGTQTVFGEGPAQADVMFVGEQPGDVEDVEGHPFVGPAGKLLDKALEQAGLDRSRAYVTNAVKHFNWDEARGKRRIHKKPNARQMTACRPWLEAEIEAVRPRVIVALGATAAQTLLGRDFKLTKSRGEPIDFPSAHPEEAEGPSRRTFVLATVHPSAILRAPDDHERRLALEMFVDDLRRVAALLERTQARR